MTNKEKNLKKKIQRWIKKSGWHISDGIDPCSGEDTELQKKEIEKLVKSLSE